MALVVVEITVHDPDTYKEYMLLVDGPSFDPAKA